MHWPVVEEGAEEAAVEVVAHEEQEVLRELEGVRELAHDLPHAVYELDEHRRAVAVLVSVIAVAHALTSGVAISQLM